MSNTQKKNVPELRFPEFEGEWKDVKFVSIFQEVSNKTSDLAKYPLFSLTVEKGITPKTERYKRDFLVKKSDNFKIVEPRDIVYNPMNVTLGAIDLSKYNYDIALSGYYHVMKIINSFNPDFISNFLKTEKMIIHYKKIATGSLMEKQRVHFSEFKNIIKKFPTNKEQQKIGDFFSKLDRQIELQVQKLELLQQQKKGYMQKIFSQELRFKDENGNDYPEWEERRFADIFKFHNKLRKPIKENLRVKGSYPYYGATGIIDYVDDFIFDGNYLLIGEDGANIITRSAPLVYLVNGKFWVNNHAHILSPLNGNIQYLYQVAELVNYEKYNTGTAQPKLNIQNLKIISVVISTNLEEQQKIGSFLSKLDRQIDLEEQKLELLQQRKKALLKSMFV
ncbi:TPA: restriction endonuclease subunit S [Staphylococcus aureus]